MAENSAYKKGLKGISVFGGLQVYKMLIGIISTKISAVFLGPAGVAIYGLFTSTLNTFESVISCGLGMSSVKDIAQAKDDPNKLSSIYKALERMTYLVGIIGFLIIIIFARQVSVFTFGNPDYAWGFRILSVTMIFNQILTAQGALLTGLTEYSLITRMRLWVGILTVITVGTLYIIWGKKGIVPAIFLSSAINDTVTAIITRKIKLPKVRISWRETLQLGGPMLTAGIFLSMSWFLNSLSGYLMRVYIGRTSDDITLGLFLSSFALVNTYLGLVFSSVSSDFYPRLSAVKEEKKEFQMVASSEMELVFLLIVPLVSMLMVFVHPVLQIFYSSKFFGANQIIIWSAMSMVLKTPSWICSIGFMAIGKTKIYLYNNLIHMAYQFGLNVLGFYLGGLLGVGLTYAIGNGLFGLQSIILLRHQGQSAFNVQAFRLMLLLVGSSTALAIWCTLTEGWLMYVVGSITATAISTYCLMELNHRIPIVQVIRNSIRKKK
ncbi:MAG: oligosaccharide flippase family protein [Muribaculum sp.]|nr:oligosaccharide flippase family protein [Muribaculum sp.]